MYLQILGGVESSKKNDSHFSLRKAIRASKDTNKNIIK